jgi:hypothetical protein
VAHYREKVSKKELTPEEATAIYDLIQACRGANLTAPSIEELAVLEVDQIMAYTRSVTHNAITLNLYGDSITPGELGSSSLDAEAIRRIRRYSRE